MGTTVAAILIAYVVTAAHYIWRDMSVGYIDRPAYARSRHLGPKLMAGATWLPVSIAMPFVIGWRWKEIGRYLISIGVFALLAVAGFWVMR